MTAAKSDEYNNIATFYTQHFANIDSMTDKIWLCPQMHYMCTIKWLYVGARLWA